MTDELFFKAITRRTKAPVTRRMAIALHEFDWCCGSTPVALFMTMGHTMNDHVFWRCSHYPDVLSETGTSTEMANFWGRFCSIEEKELSKLFSEGCAFHDALEQKWHLKS